MSTDWGVDMIPVIAGNYKQFMRWRRDQGYREPSQIKYISHREALMGLVGVVLLVGTYWESEIFKDAVIESQLGSFVLAKPQE